MNLAELLEQLRREEETVLLELLDVKSDELVDAFIEIILENPNKFFRLYE